jgi:glycosyltransferase involved in cell wall biosynthesis
VSYFVANSNNVAARIRKHYDRDSTVIYPPVCIAESYLSARPQEYYLIVSRLVEYKRVNLAVEACTYLRRPLRVIGDGYLYKQLRKIAGPTVEFLGRLEDHEVRENYADCRALLFPGEEDFGIVPVEAQSFGRPVIAYGKGGALETVRGLWPGRTSNIKAPTGVFFERQTTDSLVAALRFFESAENSFSAQSIRQSVEKFNVLRFKMEMVDFIERKMQKQHESQAYPLLDVREILA